jgi:formylglycine-generating enzyme required for sulfatase activity
MSKHPGVDHPDGVLSMSASIWRHPASSCVKCLCRHCARVMNSAHRNANCGPCANSEGKRQPTPGCRWAAQHIRLGKLESDATYGWDNEYGVENIEVDGFEASRMLVSNAEFMEFVQAGAYTQASWWTPEGTKLAGLYPGHPPQILDFA